MTVRLQLSRPARLPIPKLAADKATYAAAGLLLGLWVSPFAAPVAYL